MRARSDIKLVATPDAETRGSPANGFSGEARADEGAALDAYSRIVTSVADLLIPSVASLKIMQQVRGGRMPAGAGSGVIVTPDGYMLTSAHVVGRSRSGSASLSD